VLIVRNWLGFADCIFLKGTIARDVRTQGFSVYLLYMGPRLRGQKHLYFFSSRIYLNFRINPAACKLQRGFDFFRFKNQCYNSLDIRTSPSCHE
jgi:hypothetical protein